MANYTEFINELSAKTGLNKQVLGVWVSMEQGVNNNILGIRSASGPLMKFPSQTAAADATAKLLQSSSLYAGIRASESGTPAQQALAIVKSPWHLGPRGVALEPNKMDPYYLKGFVSAGFLSNSGNSALPSGGASTPIALPSTTPILGAWADIVKYPVGHKLTSQDVTDIVDALDAHSMFGTGLAGLPAKEVTRSILSGHIGQEWNKSLEVTLQSEFGAAANNANPINGLNLDIPGALTFVAVILVGITFLVLGGIIVLKAPKGAAR